MYLLEGMGPEQRQRVLQQLGVDLPLHEQYINYLGQLLTFNLGESFRYGVPVEQIIWLRFWNTILLMAPAFFLAYLIGISAGAVMGWVRGTAKERVGIIVTLIARSSPEFWIGVLLLMVFSFHLGWFPTGRMYPVGFQPDTFWDRYLRWGFLHHMFLPLLTGVIFYMATPALLMRSSMIQVLNSDFIEIKKAEGHPEFIILYKYAARNSILPITTVVAIVVGVTLGGSLIIETVFDWPGMGREMVESVNHNDYDMAQAVFFLMGSVVIFMNFVADIAYVFLDPRVRYE